MKRFGFPAVSSENARVLILGMLPGKKSLECKEYYAQEQNRFWWIMGRLVGALPELPYEGRLDALTERRIALWDVCASADRCGSRDSKIVMASVVPSVVSAK